MLVYPPNYNVVDYYPLPMHAQENRHHVPPCAPREGCMLATIINTRYPVSGLILIAGAAETLKDAINRQRNFLNEEIQHSKGFKFALLRLLKADKKNEAQSQKFFQKSDGIKTGCDEAGACENQCQMGQGALFA